MKSPKKYKTGDVVTLSKQNEWDYSVEINGGSGWAIVSPYYSEAFTSPNRASARLGSGMLKGGRIARVIKETPKTVTVVISK